MRKALNWIRKKYNAVPVYITETGISDHDGKLHDEKRISYFKKYTDEVLKGNSFLTKKYIAPQHIDWLLYLFVFYANFSSISAISWRGNKCYINIHTTTTYTSEKKLYQ